MTTYRLMDGLSGRPGNGPSTGTAYSGAYLAGTAFKVTQANMWLQGYWWWVCNTGQQTGAQKFALWQPAAANVATLIPNSVVTSGALTAGQWNYTALPTPIPLCITGVSASQGGAPYIAATGYTSTTGFPELDFQYGSLQPYTNGITNGPLTAYSDGTSGSASNPVPITSVAQGLFGTSSADPSAACPFTGFHSANFWVDVQVSDTPPPGYTGSYRLWPNVPTPVSLVLDTANNFTLGTEFTLSQSCTLNKIWFYSPSGVTQLPTECGIWLVSGQTLVSGTHVSSPSWSGSAGSGWVSCSYSTVTLPAGDYKVSVFNGAGTPVAWNDSSFPYWANGSGGANGITAGPLSAPNNATATSPGQSTYHQGASFVWPDTYASGIGSATYWVDVEVTPIASGLVPPLVSQFSGLY
jgi:Domain of unknown function (DUF4082)